MRMLNYSRETNPFHRSRIDIPCATKVTVSSKCVPRTSTFQDCHLMRRLNGGKAKTRLRPQSLPPSTVEFATLDDMDFIDSSTLSDDVCSILTNRSKDNPFRLDDKSNSLASNHSKQSKILFRSGTKNHGMSLSKAEVVTKGKMSGMTLMDALNRRRCIADGEKVVFEYCKQPSKPLDVTSSVAIGSNGLFESNPNAIEEMTSNSHAAINDFFVARDKLKKGRSRDKLAAAYQSSPLPKAFPASRGDKYCHRSSSSATVTTASTNFSRSNRTSEISKDDLGHTYIVKTEDNVSSKLDETRDPEQTSDVCTKEKARDDRTNVEDALSNDGNRQQLDKTELTQNAVKYNKMLQMGIPLGAVQNAMKRDLVDPSKVQLNFSSVASKNITDDAQSNMSIETSDPGQEEETTASISSHLSSTMEKNAKYMKMLKLGIPRKAVENAIQRDRIASSEICQNTTTTPIGNKKRRDPYRRTRLHWNILKKSQLSEKSIWNAIEQDEDVDKLKINESEFKALFQTKKVPQRRTICKETNTTNAVKVIDPKRANNGGITLARLKMSYDDIANAVKIMDVSNLNAQQLLGIIEFIPSAQESRSLREYVEGKRDVAALCECEKFMLSMSKVIDAPKKTQTMLFMLQFPGAINEIMSDIHIKAKACEELISSVRLRKILGIILKIGNHLNRAGEDTENDTSSTMTADANGFSVKSLSILNQVKACDRKTTVLYYIGSLIQRSNQSILRLKDDLPNVLKADSISLDHDKALINLEKQLLSARSTLPTTDAGENMCNGNEGRYGSSVHVHTFIEQANELFISAQRANEEAKMKITAVLEYFSCENDLSPHALFGIVASFCKEIDVVSTELSNNKGKKK